MKILYLSIAVWPSWEEARQKMWLWFKSVERFQNMQGVPSHQFQYYGVGTKQFPGYRAMKIECQLDWLENQDLSGYTHVFYTDSADCLMLDHRETIEEKYRILGKPSMLISAFDQLGNVSDGSRFPYFSTWEHQKKVRNPHYRYPNVGGYIMEVPLLLEYLRKAKTIETGDDCFICYQGFEEGWFRPELDSTCLIWQVQNLENSEIMCGRVKNKITHNFPSILHLSGGYTDQQTLKDHAMVPVAKQLGII